MMLQQHLATLIIFCGCLLLHSPLLHVSAFTTSISTNKISKPYSTTTTTTSSPSLLQTIRLYSSDSDTTSTASASQSPPPSSSSSSSSSPSSASTNTSSQTISIQDIEQEMKQVEMEFQSKIQNAKSLQDVENIRREYLGKKGPIQQTMKYMKQLNAEEKPKLGSIINQMKDLLETTINESMEVIELKELEQQMKEERIDVTMPGLSQMADIGRRHPLSMTMEKALDIFVKLGYDTVTDAKDSPEIETDYYCFEALNCPKDHPARDMQDTFYLSEDRELLLRTHTSAVQIRQLEKRKPPLRIVAPGRVYRRDDIDATHSLMFHQIEILALEPIGQLDLGHLKGTVEYFLKQMLGPDIETRFRGSYFPFTEPSMEVDVFFRGKWLEVLGCGMVDPRVLEKAGIDPDEYSGFAAGFGVERFAMIIHGIKDLREFVKSDKRFLKQFPHFYDDGLTTFLQGKNGTIQPHPEPEDLRTEELPHTIVESMEELRNYQYLPIDEDKVDEGKDTSINVNTKRTNSTPKQNSSQIASSEIDISKLDIRVGVIRKVWEHPNADKLYCEEIDIGEESGPRQIASGLKAHYAVDELQNRKVLVLANLKARKLVGFSSHGMVLCASSEDGSKVELIDPPSDAIVGERVCVDGFDGEPATENQVVKKKMLEAIFPDMKVNGERIATYKGKPFQTSAGVCTAKSLSNESIA